MKLEVMLSVMNLNKKNLDKMNITSKCTVINQCEKNDSEQYKNFNIYSYNEIGLSNSRNRALEHITEDIILICDADIIYSDTYEKDIITEFKNNPKADMIMFNMENPYRKKRINTKRKRIHFYNSLNYGSVNIVFKRSKLDNIKFDTLFGSNATYSNGEDALFITNFIKRKLKIYASPIFIGKIVDSKSTWFKGYTEKYFFDKGALFTAISKRFRHILMLQYLLRHRNVLAKYKFKEAYKIMKKGSADYLNRI